MMRVEPRHVWGMISIPLILPTGLGVPTLDSSAVSAPYILTHVYRAPPNPLWSLPILAPSSYPWMAQARGPQMQICSLICMNVPLSIHPPGRHICQQAGEPNAVHRQSL